MTIGSTVFSERSFRRFVVAAVDDDALVLRSVPRLEGLSSYEVRVPASKVARDALSALELRWFASSVEGGAWSGLAMELYYRRELRDLRRGRAALRRVAAVTA